MKPLLVVRILTFNHELYISQCLDSVVNQRVNFPFQIILGEDCSTDLTAQICKEYEERFPELIRVNYNEKNNLFINSQRNWELCILSGAKYIALLEGDDYWTDPYKLQKQVDFLEANPDCVVVCHDAIVVNAEGDQIENSAYAYPEHQRDFTSDELIRCRGNVLTLTMCFRNIVEEFPYEMKHAFFGDTFITSMLGQYGYSKYLPEKMAAYRKSGSGIFSGAKISVRLDHSITTYQQLAKYYSRIGMADVAKHFNVAANDQNRQHIYYSIEENNKRQLIKALINNVYLDSDHPDKLNISIWIKTLIKNLLR